MQNLRIFKEKGKALCLFWLMLLTAPLAVSAQETLTVYDGTAANQYIPMYGYYFDDYTKSECIIPATDLTDMVGGTITAITFYAKTVGTSNSTWANTSQTVFLKEVSGTTLGGSYSGMSGATIVKVGSPLAMPTAGTAYTITFDTPYDYEGGNLLIGVYNIDDGSYNKVEWYGTSNLTSGVSAYGSHTNSLSSVGYNAQSFLPKTTFTYTGGSTCPKPKNLAISNVTNTSATLSWMQAGDADHWDVFYTDNRNFKPKANTHPQFINITDNPFTLNSLPTGRTYYVYVRANCGDEVSDWSSPCVFLVSDQLTLNDGTATNQLVPVPGYYVHKSHNTQFILPASDLQDLYHAEIRRLTFYTQSPNNIDWGAVITNVRFKEVDATEMSNSYNLLVYDSTRFSGFLSVVNNQMIVTLNKPYVYKGGNLLVSFQSNGNSNANRVASYWLGVTTQNTSGYGSSYYSYYYSTGSGTYNGVQPFLPKITISYVSPDCAPPTNLVVSDITTSSATLSWTPLAEGQDWEIQYRKADETDYTTVAGTITNPYTLQGLEPSHGYFVRVRAVCDNNSFSDWAEIRFNTDCAPITLPYIYGFEDVELHGFPACWSLLVSGSTYYAETWNNDWSNTGDRCLTMYCGDTEGSVIAILPEIPVDAEHPMNANELVFYAASYYSPTTCQVGIMTDPTDLSSFELVEEMDVNEGVYGYGDYHRFRVSFADYTGNGTYIAIRKVRDAGESAETLLIDDVEVRPIPDCYEPTALTVTATTPTTTTLQWTAGGEETSWQVQYKLSYDEWPETYQTVYQNPCTLEGLTPGTAYRVRVRAACSATETSDWTDYAKFITPYSALYYEDFEEIYSSLNYSPDNPIKGWRFAYGVPIDDVLAGTAQLVPTKESSGWQFTHYSFTNPDNGMIYLNDYLAECYPNMSGQYLWIVSPYIELGEGYQLNFDLGLVYNHTASSGLDDNRFGVLITQDDGATWSLLALWDNDGTQGWAYYDLPEIPAEVNVAIPDTYNNKLVRIAFCAESVVYNSGSNHLYVDNVNVIKCIRPELIVASDITTNSAVLDWTTHGETSWTLQYRLGETGGWTTVNSITAHPYNLTGLVSSNYYQVRVKAHNANGESEWSTIAQFATECAPISLGPDETYEQYFDGNAVPACWNSETTVGGGGWIFNYTTYDSQGNPNYCAYGRYYSSTTIANLIMPEVYVTPGLTLTFHHSTRTAADISVFFDLPNSERVNLWSTATDDLSTGVTTLSLNEYAGNTIQIFFNFYASSSAYFYLYDVTLSNQNTFNKNTENGYWNETANWSAGALPQATQSVLINGEAIIPNGCVAHADEILITNSGSLTIADGGQLEHNNSGVVATAQKSITPYTIAQTEGEVKSNGWYLIASPMQNDVEPVESMISNAFDLYRFNQSVDLEWENYLQYFYLSPYFKLINGKGYLYANNNGGSNEAMTIEIEGQLQPWNEGLSLNLDYDVTASFAGWNLVGNPFAHNVTTYATTNVAEGCFRMNDTRDDLMVSEISATDPLQPMEGFFVKATGMDATITFNAQGNAKSSGEEGSIFVEVSENGKTLDRLIVKGSDRKPLEKFSLNDRRTKVFTVRDHREMAIVPCEGNEQAVSFKAAKNGAYTINVNVENMDLAYLHLIDNMTGADVDLLQTPEYTFEAKSTDYASRFKLVFSTNGNTDGDEASFAFISNGNIIVNGTGTLQVFDVLGRQVFTKELSTANYQLSTANFPTGVYVLRLIQGDDVKTQKIVVR